MLPSRLYNLDFARAIASFAIVVWHWQHFSFVAGHPPKGFSVSDQPFHLYLAPLYDKTATIAVPFFFTLSGFVFFWQYLSPIITNKCGIKEYAVNRFARLYPLHFMTLCFVTVLQWIYFQLHGEWFVYQFNDIYHWFLNVLFISSWGPQLGQSFNGPAWSVSIEVGLYSLFFCYAKSGKASFVNTIFVILLLDLVRRLEIHAIWPEAMECFFIGGLCYYIVDYYLSQPAWPRAEKSLILATALCWFAFLYLPPLRQWIYWLDLTHYLLLPGALISLILLEKNGRRIPPEFAWIGDTTYSTYLLHFPLQLVFILVAARFGMADRITDSSFAFLLFMTILFSISLLTYRAFERPCQRCLRQRFKSRK